MKGNRTLLQPFIPSEPLFQLWFGSCFRIPPQIEIFSFLLGVKCVKVLIRVRDRFYGVVEVWGWGGGQ